MLTNLNIQKLYDLFDYQLNFDNEESLKIITGPNGFGKTTILNMINSVLRCNFWYFYFLQFKSIEFIFKIPNKAVTRLLLSTSIENNATEDDQNAYKKLDVIYTQGQDEIEKFSLGLNLYKKAKRLYKKSFDFDDLYFMNNFNIEDDVVLNQLCPNWGLYCHNYYCNYQQDQRITYYDEEEPYEELAHTINNIADSFKFEFKNAQRDFVFESQKLDANFISRLMAIDKHKINEEDIDIRWKKLQERIERLNRYQLVPEYKELDPLHRNDYKEVLSLYLDDMKAKLDQLEPFYEKVSLLDEFLRKEDLSYKKVLFSKGRLLVKSDTGAPIPLDKLSSGEQNLIILCYELVFHTAKNTILLVDEPENSLHVSWVDSLLEFYKAIADKNQCQIIISTHSPVFIDGQWDLTYDLFDNNLNEI